MVLSKESLNPLFDISMTQILFAAACKTQSTAFKSVTKKGKAITESENKKWLY